MREPVTITSSGSSAANAGCIHVAGIKHAEANSAYRFLAAGVRNVLISMTTSRERAQTLAPDIVKTQAGHPTYRSVFSVLMHARNAHPLCRAQSCSTFLEPWIGPARPVLGSRKVIVARRKPMLFRGRKSFSLHELLPAARSPAFCDGASLFSGPGKALRKSNAPD